MVPGVVVKLTTTTTTVARPPAVVVQRHWMEEPPSTSSSSSTKEKPSSSDQVVPDGCAKKRPSLCMHNHPPSYSSSSSETPSMGSQTAKRHRPSCSSSLSSLSLTSSSCSSSSMSSSRSGRRTVSFATPMETTFCHSLPSTTTTTTTAADAVGDATQQQDEEDHVDDDTWYTPQDYQHFEQDVRTSIQIMQSQSQCGVDNDDSSSTVVVESRGLEKYASVKGHKEQKLREELHLLAILRECKRQYGLQGIICNPSKLTRLSQQTSAWATNVARHRAATQCIVDGMKNGVK